MNRTLKTVLTVIVCTVCVFVSFCSLCYSFYIQRQPLKNESIIETRLQLKEAYIEPFDDEAYRDYQKDGYDIYKLHLTIENYGGRLGYGDVLYMYYSPTDSYSYISEISRAYFSENDTIIPPGKEAVINRILYVPEECSEFTVKYSDYKAKGEQVLTVKVPRP